MENITLYRITLGAVQETARDSSLVSVALSAAVKHPSSASGHRVNKLQRGNRKRKACCSGSAVSGSVSCSSWHNSLYCWRLFGFCLTTGQSQPCEQRLTGTSRQLSEGVGLLDRPWSLSLTQASRCTWLLPSCSDSFLCYTPTSTQQAQHTVWTSTSPPWSTYSPCVIHTREATAHPFFMTRGKHLEPPPN